MNPNYKVIAGSYMYGTNVQDSDLDIRGWYLPSDQHFFGLSKGPESIAGDGDVMFWEFRKYINMCLSGNPNVLETLFAPRDCILFEDEFASQLRTHRRAFLSKKLAHTYLGYAISNYQRIIKNGFDRKDAMHLIRLLRTGNEVLTTGGFVVRREKDIPDLLKIRSGQTPWSDVEKEFVYYKESWADIKNKSLLPDEPDRATVEKVVFDILTERFR